MVLPIMEMHYIDYYLGSMYLWLSLLIVGEEDPELAGRLLDRGGSVHEFKLCSKLCFLECCCGNRLY